MNKRLKECKKCGHYYDEFFMVKKTEGYECIDCAYEAAILGQRVMLLEDMEGQKNVM